jgi:hypothetical protein
MLRNRLVHLVAAFALVALVGCNGDDTQTRVDADTTLITEPTMETREVRVPGEDTLMVERRVETDVTVDTTRIEGQDTIRRM